MDYISDIPLDYISYSIIIFPKKYNMKMQYDFDDLPRTYMTIFQEVTLCEFISKIGIGL